MGSSREKAAARDVSAAFSAGRYVFRVGMADSMAGVSYERGVFSAGGEASAASFIERAYGPMAAAYPIVSEQQAVAWALGTGYAPRAFGLRGPQSRQYVIDVG